uniref:Uncharacterized protein n=1 Tax=Opuntia streptacantha TaxID=393608 RepID=A0A7C9ENL8_OPUST
MPLHFSGKASILLVPGNVTAKFPCLRGSAKGITLERFPKALTAFDLILSPSLVRRKAQSNKNSTTWEFVSKSNEESERLWRKESHIFAMAQDAVIRTDTSGSRVLASILLINF